MATLTNCTISGNTGVGINNFGTLTVTNCTISGNSASGSGGGLRTYYHGVATLTDCTVSGNTGGTRRRR